MTINQNQPCYTVDTGNGAGGFARRNGRVRRRSSPSLRPPTLMIDLLFGALMLFAFQMGDPTARAIAPFEVNLPTASKETDAGPEELMPLKPVSVGENEWAYETVDGNRLTPDQVAASARGTGRTIVLLLSADARVQNYIDAELPLQRRGLRTGLAVELGRGDSR